MQRHTRSLGSHKAFHLAMIAFACLLMALLSGIFLAHPAYSKSPVLASHNHHDLLAVPFTDTDLDVRFAEDSRDEVVELTETTDDDDIQHLLLPVDVVFFGGQTVLYHLSPESSRALTPFRLLAFSSCGPPSA